LGVRLPKLFVVIRDMSHAQPLQMQGLGFFINFSFLGLTMTKKFGNLVSIVSKTNPNQPRK